MITVNQCSFEKWEDITNVWRVKTKDGWVDGKHYALYCLLTKLFYKEDADKLKDFVL